MDHLYPVIGLGQNDWRWRQMQRMTKMSYVPDLVLYTPQCIVVTAFLSVRIYTIFKNPILRNWQTNILQIDFKKSTPKFHSWRRKSKPSIFTVRSMNFSDHLTFMAFLLHTPEFVLTQTAGHLRHVYPNAQPLSFLQAHYGLLYPSCCCSMWLMWEIL